MLHSANSNRLVILSEVTNGNEAEGPAVALPAKLPPSVILSEVTNGNEAEGPAVAFRIKLRSSLHPERSRLIRSPITQTNLPKMMQKMRQIILSQKS